MNKFFKKLIPIVYTIKRALGFKAAPSYNVKITFDPQIQILPLPIFYLILENGDFFLDENGTTRTIINKG